MKGTTRVFNDATIGKAWEVDLIEKSTQNMFYKNPGEKTNKQRPSLVHDICSWYADAGETLPDHSSLDTDWLTFLFVSKDVAEFIFWMRKVSPLFHLVITWWSIGDHLVPIWRPNGDHLVTTWGLPIDVLFPCGQHMAIYSNPPIWYPIIFFQPHNIKTLPKAQRTIVAKGVKISTDQFVP